MNINPSISHRTIKNRHRDGTRVEYSRYIVEFRDPRSGHRKARKFKRRLDAVAFRNELIIQLKDGSYINSREAPTVAEAAEHYLADRANHVKANTLHSYRLIMKRITDPLLIGTPQQRADYSLSGAKPGKARFIPTLGKVKISDLTTAKIRQWHNMVAEQCGDYTARRAAAHLKMVLALAEEDFGVRAPTMPANLARRKPRVKKTILKPEDVGLLLEGARLDKQRGIYYAFPFLAGTRPSEQLGLLWSDVDLNNSMIRIRRVQERNGTLTDMTKTKAGTREIPIAPSLLAMLLEWQVICPRKQGELHRVFPGPGRLQPWPLPRTGGGGACKPCCHPDPLHPGCARWRAGHQRVGKGLRLQICVQCLNVGITPDSRHNKSWPLWSGLCQQRKLLLPNH